MRQKLVSKVSLFRTRKTPLADGQKQIFEPKSKLAATEDYC
jgi:hypothetical protein